ncbi:DUF1211 domain-containing protein [Phycicoccus sp. HDW14]|nr:DUF1211 domain-containing protein [Phycicoccus sp. HDW14]
MTAIAMTLLVLPLVEMSGEVEADRLSAFFTEHWDLVLSFIISFLVIYVFWAAHGSAYRRVVEADVDISALRPLNMLWLLVVAFLPFPTAVVGRELTTTSATFYIGTMFVLSGLTSAITTVVDGHLGTNGRTGWAWATTAVFAACTLLALVDPDLGLVGLLALALLRVVEVRIALRWAPNPPAEAAAGTPPVQPSTPDNEGAADEHLRAVTADTGTSDPSGGSAGN